MQEWKERKGEQKMETKQRTREAVTPPEESLDQKIQSVEMKMEQKFAAMSILVGNMATFLTMQQERIRALEEQIYKEQTPGTVEKQPGAPPQEASQNMLATEKQRDFLQRLGVKDIASDLTKEHASVLIEGRLRELRATKTAEPASQPEHTAPKRTTAHHVRQAQEPAAAPHHQRTAVAAPEVTAGLVLELARIKGVKVKSINRWIQLNFEKKRNLSDLDSQQLARIKSRLDKFPDRRTMPREQSGGGRAHEA